jgi:hypothetical protein
VRHQRKHQDAAVRCVDRRAERHDQAALTAEPATIDGITRSGSAADARSGSVAASASRVRNSLTLRFSAAAAARTRSTSSSDARQEI